MSIDIRTEDTRCLTEATKLPCFQNRRNGSRISTSTLWRWSITGCKGVILETVKIGGSRVTSVEAIERFVERLAEVEASGRPAVPAPAPLPAARRKSIDAAKKRLAAAGIL